MKAIKIGNEIKTYSSLTTYGGTMGLQYATDSHLKSLGFYSVVTPKPKPSQKLGAIKWDADNEVFTYPIQNKTFSETAIELKQDKIAQVKNIYKGKLAETDWYILRSQEGIAAPQSILDARAALRSESAIAEAEINALTTKASIIDYELADLI